jgi:hypothetical protein
MGGGGGRVRAIGGGVVVVVDMVLTRAGKRRLVDNGSTCAGRNWALVSSMVLAATKFRESASHGIASTIRPSAAARREWSSPRRLPSGLTTTGASSRHN